MTWIAGIMAGWLTGWGINVLADRLPRFSEQHRPSGQASFSPATWEALTGRWQTCFWLRLGVEISSAVCFGLLVATGSPATLALGWAFFLLVAVIDLKYRLVLNVMVYPAIGLLALVGLLAPKPLPVLMGGALAFGIFFVTAWLKPGSLGGGDVKLAVLIGLLFGFPQVLGALLVAAAASAVAIGILVVGRRNSLQTRIPYAPFMCLGALALLVYQAIF